MLIDAYAREDVFAQVPKLAAEIDPELRKLDTLLDMMRCTNRCAVTSGSATATRWCMGDTRPQWRCSCAC